MLTDLIAWLPIKSFEVMARGRKNQSDSQYTRLQLAFSYRDDLNKERIKRRGYTQRPFRQKPYVFAFV